MPKRATQKTSSIAARVKAAPPWQGDVPEVWSGATVWGGRVQLDHNQAINQSQWFGWGSSMGLVDQIPREDAVAQAIVLAWQLPVSSLSWDVAPADDSADALEVARVIRAALSAVPGRLRGVVRQAAAFATRGFALLQPRIGYDPEARIGARRGAYVLRRVAEIGPSVVDRWIPHDEGRWGLSTVAPTGDVSAGTVRRSVVFGPDDFLRLAWRPEDGAPVGLGLLRPAYALWQQRRTYLRLELQGFERGAFGIPILKAGPTARPADAANAQSVVRELRTGARAWAQLPEGWSIDFADFPFSAAEIREARIQAGRDMARAALVPHLYTGEGNGTESLIDGQLDFAALGWADAADQIADALQPLANQLTAANFGDASLAPRITHSRVAVRGAGQLVAALQSAVAAGVLTPDRDTESTIRDILDLPDLPEMSDDEWAARSRRMAGTPVGDAPMPAAPAPDVARQERVDLSEPSPLAGRVVADAITSGPGGRAVLDAERVVRFSETRGRTETARDVLAAVTTRWRARVAQEYAADVAAAARGGLARMSRVEVPGQKGLIEDLRRELRGVYRAGQQSAAAELDRMRADPALRAAAAAGDVAAKTTPSGPRIVTASDHRHDTWPPRCCGMPRVLGLMVLAEDAPPPPRPAKRRKPRDGGLDIDRIEPEAAIRGVATATAAALSARISAAALAAVQNAGYGGAGLSPDEVRATVAESTRALSSGVDSRQAQADANAIFGLGRQQEQRAEGVKKYLYSNLLESAVCGPCEAAHGATFGAEDLDYYATPATWCEGGDLCNCLVIGLVGDE